MMRRKVYDQKNEQNRQTSNNRAGHGAVHEPRHLCTKGPIVKNWVVDLDLVVEDSKMRPGVNSRRRSAVKARGRLDLLCDLLTLL